MSDSLYVLCRSGESLTRADLANFIHDGYFFDGNPRFAPPPSEPTAFQGQWGELEVEYHASQRPIVIARYGINSEMLAAVTKEIVEEHQHVGLGRERPDLVERIRATRQLFVLEYDASSITDEAWEMMDCAEAYIARQLDGLIFVHGEGIYDPDLQLIYRIGPKK